MKKLIDYILKFGDLNKQQIELVESKMTEIELQKDDYFSEARKIPKQVGFILEGVIRGCYYNNKGEEITRHFVCENSLVVDYVHFEANTVSSEYLQASTEPRIVMVSSSQGSMTLHSDPTSIHYNAKGAVYQSSKSALNMYTIVLAYELRDTPFKVNAVSPGSTKTDFSRGLGQGSVEDAGNRIVKYALIDNDGPTGKFFAEDMNTATGEIPW